MSQYQRQTPAKSHAETWLELDFLAHQSEKQESHIFPHDLAPTTTALLPISLDTVSWDRLRRQLTQLCLQSTAPDRIWVVYSVQKNRFTTDAQILQAIPVSLTKPLQSLDECYTNERQTQIQFHVVGDAHRWMSVVSEVESERLWIMTDDLLPGDQYLEQMQTILSLEAFRNSIIGAYGMIFYGENAMMFPSLDPLVLPDRFLECHLLSGSWFGRTVEFQHVIYQYLRDRSNGISETIIRALQIPEPLFFADMQLNVAFSLYGSEGTWLSVLPTNTRESSTWADSFNLLASTEDKRLRVHYDYRRSLQNTLEAIAFNNWIAAFAAQGIRFDSASDHSVAFIFEMNQADEASVNDFRQVMNRFWKEKHSISVTVLSRLPCATIVSALGLDPNHCELSTLFYHSNRVDSIIRMMQRLQPSVLIASDSISAFHGEVRIPGINHQPAVILLKDTEWQFFGYFATLDAQTLESKLVSYVNISFC